MRWLPRVAAMSFYFRKPFTPYDLRAVIDSGRTMTVEEATDIVRRGLANSSDVSKSDRELAYAVLMNDWAEPHGLTLVLDGWWRMIGLCEVDGPPLLPGDRGVHWSETLWTKFGQPVAYVSQPLGLSLETWKLMERRALNRGLEFFVFDKRGWSEPDRSDFVVSQPEDD